MTEREDLARLVLAAGVDLNEDGVGSEQDNALRIADALLSARDPGAPRTDELARNAAFRALTDLIGRESGEGVLLTYATPAQIAAHLTATHTVTWERDVNAGEVAVRRYVLRGAWEVDPEAVARRAGS